MRKYTEYSENLTYLQKAALEGEIAFSIATTNHDADLIYRIYSILITVPKNYYSYVLSCFRELCELPEEVFFKIRSEITADNVPLWIWRNKCIADLKESLKLSVQNHSDVSANFKKIRKKLLESAFILFCRKTSMIHGTPVIELCDEILNDNSLEFLHVACSYIKKEIEITTEPRLTKKLLKQIMTSCFDIRDILSFSIEYEEFKKHIKENAKEDEKGKKEKKKSSLEESESFDEIIQTFFNAVTSVKKPQENIQYVVRKVFKGSGKGTVLKTFDTKSEAEDFIAGIMEQFPDLKSTCTFIIEQGKLRSE